MVLSSQMPRAGYSRQYMVSRRRRGRKLPLIIGAVALVALGWLLVSWMGGESGSSDGAGSAPGADGAPAGVATGGPDSVAGQSVPPGEEPLVGAFTLGHTPAEQPAPQGPDPRFTAPPAQQTQPPREQQQPAPPVSTGVAQTPRTAAAQLRQGLSLVTDGQFVEGRRALSKLLFASPAVLTAADAQTVRDTLASINSKLIFSSEAFPGDDLTEMYKVKSGDRLARIAPRYKIPYQFVEQINGVEARRLRAGQFIKLVRGPFHARVSKRAFRMDVFLFAPDGAPIFIKSFPVGLGSDDSTPVGRWRVEDGRKVHNPDWRNPRTGQYYAKDDPNNPIGEYWLALEGVDENTEGLKGYGIHGTNEPHSIGRQMSMGCVRLRAKDIEQVYFMLEGGASLVDVVP